MQSPSAQVPPLTSYPYQVTFPARFGDLGASGYIEHIGMARYYEDARSAFAEHLAERNGIDRGLWRSFLVRAINVQLAPVSYPDPLAFGAGVIAVGGGSYAVEVGAFQSGLCVGRSRSIAAAVGADRAAAPLPQQAREVLSMGLVARPEWRAPGKPAAERRQLAYYAHRLSLPARFSDTDAIGHFNNIALLRYCDEGRAAVLLAAQQGRLEPGWAGTVVHADISYLQEARLPHPVTVGSTLGEIDGAHICLEQALFQRDVCVAVCDCTVQLPEQGAQRLRAALASSAGATAYS